jgi:hypothetical protein
MAKLARQLLDAITHSGPSYNPPPLPRRGDHVEAWLKKQRDEHDSASSHWGALDLALDDYRLHADTGTPLDQHACEGSFCEHDEESA